MSPPLSPSTPSAPALTDASGTSLFEQLGGEAKLRPIIDDFVDAVFSDVMIGFFFKNANRERIKAKEYEHAAEHLGGPVTYSGRPLREAHAPHAIMGGQFLRRLQILKQTLARHGATEAVVEHFVRHTESLRAEITPSIGGECDPGAAHGESR